MNGNAMNFRLKKKELLERAKLVEQDAYRVKTAQAQDILRLLAACYRDMARELGKGSEVRKYMHRLKSLESGKRAQSSAS